MEAFSAFFFILWVASLKILPLYNWKPVLGDKITWILYVKGFRGSKWVTYSCVLVSNPLFDLSWPFSSLRTDYESA